MKLQATSFIGLGPIKKHARCINDGVLRCLVALAAAASRSSCVTGLAENMNFLVGHQTLLTKLWSWKFHTIPSVWASHSPSMVGTWGATTTTWHFATQTDRILGIRDAIWKRIWISLGHQNEHDVLTNCCSKQFVSRCFFSDKDDKDCFGPNMSKGVICPCNCEALHHSNSFCLPDILLSLGDSSLHTAANVMMWFSGMLEGCLKRIQLVSWATCPSGLH